MAGLPFVVVDAFAQSRFTGNPCAVVFDADGLDRETMLAIAREMNHAETSFVLQPERSDLRARYFTLQDEILLAGHPTIATVHALIETGRLRRPSDEAVLSLEIGAGVIEVAVKRTANADHLITMNQLRPEFGVHVDPSAICGALGLTPSDLRPGCPVQVVSTGTPQIMIPVKNVDVLARANPDFHALAKLKHEYAISSFHLFSVPGLSPDAMTIARNFDAPPEILEDPFTGSATGAMAAYLWHHELTERTSFIAEQGHFVGRPGRAFVEIVSSVLRGIETVKVGGTGVLVSEGTIHV